MSLFLSLAILVVSLVGALGLGEAILRAKNRSMQNYDIEMWRYARELKTPSSNPLLGHDHRANRRAVLQTVEIRLDDHGLRGVSRGPRPPGRRRIMVLGGSIALGWGVPEAETMPALLERMFRDRGQTVEVLNAGVGNYNAERYAERYLTELADLDPTDILALHEELEAWRECWRLGTAGVVELLEWDHFEYRYYSDPCGELKRADDLSDCSS